MEPIAGAYCDIVGPAAIRRDRNLFVLFERANDYRDKLLKDEKVRNFARSTSDVVRISRQLENGLRCPPNILPRADEVIG